MNMTKVAGIVLLAGMLSGHAWAEDVPASSKRPTTDTNNDGKVSYEEYRAANEKKLESRFKRMDTNGDGSIDADEKQKVKDKMRDLRAKRKTEKQTAP